MSRSAKPKPRASLNAKPNARQALLSLLLVVSLPSSAMLADAQASLQPPQSLPLMRTVAPNSVTSPALNSTPNLALDTAVKHDDAASALADSLIQQALQKNLATHPTWLRLHYYAKDKASNNQDSNRATSAYRSKIDNRSFFVSGDGRDNPQTELNAFIRALVAESMGDTAQVDGVGAAAVKQTNQKLSCRFPARTHWLMSQLDSTQLRLAQPGCPALDAWLQKLDPQRLSVVFAEEYPDNPVSAFGHTLMLIDSAASLADPSAIDKAHALNDTVGGNEEDAFVLFTAKSIIGSYPNDISIAPYPQHLSEYLQVDNRDVWTYALNLTDAEVQQIMRHVWESKDLKLPYYFTLDNCASEILRYIDVVRPQAHLLDRFRVAVVPADIIRLLEKEGLISEQHYIPADKTLAQAKRNHPALAALPSSSMSAAQKLLITPLTPADNNTLDAHARQRAMVAVGTIEGSGEDGGENRGYVSLGYRGGFNDPLDRPSGYPQNFHLEFGALTLRVYDNKHEHTPMQSNTQANATDHERLELQELTLLRGRSLHPLNTARSGDSTLSSWGMTLQAVQVNDGSQPTENRHLVGNAAFEKGVAMAFGTPSAGTGELPPHLCYALGVGSAQVGKGLNNGYRLGAGVNVGCRYLINHRARLLAELQLPYWYHGDIDAGGSSQKTQDGYWQPMLTLGAQFDIDNHNAIRLQGSHQWQDNSADKDELQLAYSHYF